MKKYILFFSLLFSTTCFAQNLNENLLLYYPFNGNANDSSGNGYHANVFGGTTLTTDRFDELNSAYYFDGVNDYIELPNTPTLKPQLPVSFSFWIKYDDNNANNCAVFNTSFEDNRSVGVFFNIQNSTKKFSIGYGDGRYNYGALTRRSYISAFEMDTTEWHFIVAVITGHEHMKIYYDCEWKSGGIYSGSGSALNYSFYPGCIGRHDQDLYLPAYYFKGKIDDFRYWNRALLPSDVRALCAITEVADNPDGIADFNVYPNPATEWLYVETNFNSKYIITVLDRMGRTCYQTENVKRINLSHLAPGLYVVCLTSAKGDQLLKKIVVQ